MDSQLSGQISTAEVEEIIYFKNKGSVVSPDDSDDQDGQPAQQLGIHKKYGNMKVIHEGNILITLGPDYACFLLTFIIFTVVSFMVILMVHRSTDNLAFNLSSYVICLGECLSYLFVAISNPGIVTDSADDLPQKQLKKCVKCDLVVPRGSRHCGDCDVCITDYDHHCPWTSKCIGGNNLVRFYIFLIWTPFYLVYITIAFVVCISQSTLSIKQLPQ